MSAEAKEEIAKALATVVAGLDADEVVAEGGFLRDLFTRGAKDEMRRVLSCLRGELSESAKARKT